MSRILMERNRCPPGQCQADCNKVRQQLELDPVVCILQIDRHSQCLFFPLESFIQVRCKCSCIFPCFLVLNTPPLPVTPPPRHPPTTPSPNSKGVCPVSLRSLTSFLAMVHSVSLPVVVCTVRIQNPFSLQWSYPASGKGFMKLCVQSLGMHPLPKCP